MNWNIWNMAIEGLMGLYLKIAWGKMSFNAVQHSVAMHWNVVFVLNRTVNVIHTSKPVHSRKINTTCPSMFQWRPGCVFLAANLSHVTTQFSVPVHWSDFGGEEVGSFAWERCLHISVRFAQVQRYISLHVTLHLRGSCVRCFSGTSQDLIKRKKWL